MKTKNIYRYPIDPKLVLRVTSTDSPAHIGDLVNCIDFIVPIGTAVHAMQTGMLVDFKADGYRGGDTKDFEPEGNFVELAHDKGEFSEYEHLNPESIPFSSNDLRKRVVRKGEIIGYSGKTGWLGGLGPHLHVGVYPYLLRNGAYVKKDGKFVQGPCLKIQFEK